MPLSSTVMPDSKPPRPVQVSRGRATSGYLGVVDFLRREISLGRLLPGDRLPAERKFAEQLGVARETLRQALRVLEGSGQILIVRGTSGGAVVQDHGLSPEFVRHELRARRVSLLSLVEYRAEIEAAAARIAAERHQSADIEAMREAQAQLGEATNKDEFRRADTAFHLAVAQSSGNAHLAAAVEDARAEMFLPVDLADFDFVKETSHTEHHAVLEAIAAGEGERAATLMREHIERTRRELLQVIDG